MLKKPFFYFILILFVISAEVAKTQSSEQALTNNFENASKINNLGMPGAIDTPTAENYPDGQFSLSSSIFAGTLRTHLSFQVLENISASFRYARIPAKSGDYNGYYWDRSFDVHYLAFKEKNYFPSIAVGLRDFIGTGKYSGEYLVASKKVGEKLNFSAGLGWGRLAGTNRFSNVLGLGNTRRGSSSEMGGTLHIDQFFSGKNSPFFSIIYKFNEDIDLVGELSSDAYAIEASSPKGINRKTDLNLGLKYSFGPSLSLMAMLMHGNSIGLSANLAINPKNAPYKSGLDTAPMPLVQMNLLPKQNDPDEKKYFYLNKTLLELDGIELKRMKFLETKVEVDIVDRNYFNVSQMIGRVVRIISKTIPSNFRKINVNLIDHYTGFYISSIEIDRKSLEENELLFEGPKNFWKTTKVENVKSDFKDQWKTKFAPLTWSLYPDVDIMLFDPNAPIRWSIGFNAKARYRLMDNTSLTGSLKNVIIGTIDDIEMGAKEGLPNVRSDFMYYHKGIGNRIFIDNFTLDQFFKPFSNVYGQINIGYLELMYAGLRSELIWKDSSNPYGLGLDLAKVQKRQTDGGFDLKSDGYSSYLASLYYQLPNKWNIKVDAGKYLAGDYGSTFSVKRNFNNGWEIGAFATLTDVKFNAFGEGSFDKGIIIKAPLNWFTGKKSKGLRNTIIRPISGDGGATLYLDDEKYLYRNLQSYDERSFQNNWKRVFR